MALILHNAGREPLGQFDALDASAGSFKGGEAVVFSSVTTKAAGGTDEATADVINDGYVPTANTRPAVTFANHSSNPPVFLSDDGTKYYGTLFGVLVGSVAGQTSYGPGGGTNLGPSTTAGSGKVTLWDKPGLYGVTLDAVDTAADGLIPNSTVSTGGAMAVGKAITWTALGLLTPSGSTAGTGESGVIGYVVEFANSGSAVTTQGYMVAALNSPSGDVTSLAQQTLTQCVFWYVGASA